MPGAQIEMDETVIEDVVTSSGLHTLHVMRRGLTVSKFAWAQKWIDAQVPEECQGKDCLSWFVTPEKDSALDYWHLTLYWNAREMVDFSRVKGTAEPGLRYGVLWYKPLGAGTYTEAINLAARLYLIHTGRAATAAWIREVPPSRREAVETEYGPVRVETGVGWVPEKYFVVGVPREEWDPRLRGGRYE